MIERNIASVLESLARQYPVITITGPRQSGKTTLARTQFPKLPYLSLENPDTRQFASDDPRGFLRQYSGGAIFDEIQQAPAITSYLQEIVDANPEPGRFILTGSQQFALMSHVAQSLAGRTALLTLLPLTLNELNRLVQANTRIELPQTLLSGFFPRIHHRRLSPEKALADYFVTYVQRDLRQLAAIHDLQRFERFVRLCAGRTGQLLNLSQLGNDAGVSHVTARAWIDLLQTSHLIYLLPPWFTNHGKRLIKSPKLYFTDVGLACWLLGLRHPNQVLRDPLLGALFETLIVIEALKDRLNRGESTTMYFYRDSIGHEIDLLLPTTDGMHAIEIKAGATVSADYFKGLRTVSEQQPGLIRSGCVIFAGDDGQARTDWPVISWRRLLQAPGAPN
ncbi:MAG: hypothetical protein RI906_3457 [Pseudomonadota bacterium]|jgi:predicted AAA+ superfamily ATPase